MAVTTEQEEWEELHRVRVRVAPSSEKHDLAVYVVERLASEQLWEAPAVPRAEEAPPRVTFFGLKGGVGRSTALVATAQHFAGQNRRVLVVDLDLESPGITSLLLPIDNLPDHGVADWLVEETFGQQDAVLPTMHSASPLTTRPGARGEIFVVPALGRRSAPLNEPTERLGDLLRDGSYVAKLGRLYASLSGHDLAHRLDAMLRALEAELSPDVILLDSRAGLHELSAATIPRLGSTVLLFASDSEQTWLGYRLLFSCWQRDRRVLAPFRERLRVVAAMIPETERKTYLGRLTQNAHSTFASFLYEAEDGPDAEAFNFQIIDDQAPHHPLPIYWRRELMGWDPREPESLTREQFDAAFKPFLSGLEALLELPEATAPVDTLAEDVFP
ncbi:MAG: hypothetical protein MUF64_00805 [Polyangiaceae bacterium]|nr:hypothetical protein [Polyangiaceae bacterium]